MRRAEGMRRAGDPRSVLVAEGEILALYSLLRPTARFGCVVEKCIVLHTFCGNFQPKEDQQGSVAASRACFMRSWKQGGLSLLLVFVLYYSSPEIAFQFVPAIA